MVIVFTYILHARINCMDAFFYSASHPFVSPAANYSLTQTFLQADKSLHLSFMNKASVSATAMQAPAPVSHLSTCSEIITEEIEKSHHN